MGQIIVDTSALVSLARQGVGQSATFLNGNQLLIPTIVIAEFKAGLELMQPSRAKSKQIEVFNDLFSDAEILDFGLSEANQFAIFDALLLSNGRKMSDFDLAIAAHAAIKQAPILTLDKKAQFDFLPGINVRDF